MTPLQILIATNVLTVALFLAKYVLDGVKGSDKEHTRAIMANTIAITRLEVQLENLNRSMLSFPKMQKDIDAAHATLRRMNGDKARDQDA